MRRKDGRLLFSPSDLVGFLGCAHRTATDLRAFDDPAFVRAEAGDSERLFQNKGDEHERAFLERLRVERGEVVTIDAQGGLEARAAATRHALAGGADVVYQAVFLDPPWHGFADFLYRVPGPTDLGAFGYEVADTKLARSPRAKHVVQIGLYSALLAKLQGRAPRRMHLVLGDLSTASFPVSSFSRYVARARSRFEAFVAAPPAESSTEPCEACDLCPWRDRCEAHWQETDHLCMVANIRRSQIDRLRAAGVTTVRALAGLADDAAVPRLDRAVLERLRSQARLQVHKRDTGKDAVELLPAVEGRGFHRMPPPDPGDLFFDMEGDPLVGDGLEYLFGFHFLEAGTPVFRPFWAHDPAGEKAAFEAVMDFLAAHLAAHPAARVYHYNHYEETALKRLASRHGTREEELDDLLRGHRLVDLFKVVREAVRVSEPRYSIKNLETFYMDRRDGEVTNAADSIVVYEKWRETRDDKLLRDIASYNEVDCVSTRLLRDWLLGLRPAGLPWFSPEEKAPTETAEARRQTAEEHERRVRALVEGHEDDPRRVLTAHLLGFHRREEKPGWWAYFERLGAEDGQLIDDAECIGGANLNESVPPFQEKQSRVFTYRFPDQETKFQPGDDVLSSDTGAGLGKIHALDRDGGRVQIKTKKEVPRSVSFMPGKPLGTKQLREAVARYADSVIEGRDAFPALTALLGREGPRIRGLAPGSPVAPEGEDAVVAATRAISNLDGSYLLVQGPPGAGKTHLSAEVIVSLLAAGRRVGVSSNSHKAIVNLLKAVEARAAERKVFFAGVYRGSKEAGADLPSFEIAPSQPAFLALANRPDVRLLAGMAWALCDPGLEQALDVLFVDEASQVSLGHLVAMGTAAKNLVLVGDQMQLGQPIQGSHPEPSGRSALEFLLEGLPTVPPERGLFLDRTFRMGKELTRFVSELAYEGRLRPAPGRELQRLVLEGPHHAALGQGGLSFVPVEHRGRSQSSEEEAAVVRAIVDDLLGRAFVDHRGGTGTISLDDILVVSPYNAQVNLLRGALPDGARVGTVDKFQGQEGQVSIVSMATSSGDDLPRNIEFLYSRSRLNVAVSRARILAVVVASPRLMDIPCHAVHQLELVNSLCWVGEG